MQSNFKLDEDIVYLNHAAVAPWPLRTADAVKAFADENARQGSRDYDLWLQREKALRAHLAQLINAASTDEIALLKSTSEGLSVIAYGLPWQAGDNIVIPAEEFPSNRIVWQSLQSQGVDTRMVPVNKVEDPEQALMDACDGKTSATGTRVWPIVSPSPSSRRARDRGAARRMGRLRGARRSERRKEAAWRVSTASSDRTSSATAWSS